MLEFLRTRLPNPNVILSGCLGGLVLLPLVAAATFGAGARAERERFEIYATMAGVLQVLQDAEVDFSLARRSGQAFLRAGAAADRAAVGELSSVARLKIQSIPVPAGEAAIAVDLAALDKLLVSYAEQSAQAFELVDQRRQLAERGLRMLGDQIEADLSVYAARWQRVGLVDLAGELARARIAIANPGTEGAYGPDELQRAIAQPIGLAATAEIPVPEAAGVVRRIQARLDELIGQWRALIVLDQRIAETFSGQILAPGREVTARLQALTDRLQLRQTASLTDGKREAARNDVLMWTTLVFLFGLSIAGAFAAWAAFAAQRQRARSEAARRNALETALAQLDAAIRGSRASGEGVVLRLPPIAPAPPPAPEPVAMPRAMPEPAPESAVPAAKDPMPAKPRRTPLKRIASEPSAEPAAAAPVQAAEPSTDALIAMLMQSIAEPESDKGKK
ncbi:MAG: hypothetical protein HY059_23415 [Proteobacteria bacterium]|nr:hypothetical protein [Pseudomonadota bacterium]